MKKRISLLAMLVLVLSLMFGSTALASGKDIYSFDFDATQIKLAKGDTYNLHLKASCPYSCYCVGIQGKQTYVQIDGNQGNSNVTIHVGDDETATGFTLYFYLDDHDIWDNVNVDIVDPIHSDNTETRTAAIKAQMQGTAAPAAATAVPAAAAATGSASATVGTVGTVSTVQNGCAALLTSTAGVPVAAFSVAGADGKLVPMTVGNAVPFGTSWYITVNTTTGVSTINIQAADKAAMIQAGVPGLYLNGHFVNWQ